MLMMDALLDLLTVYRVSVEVESSGWGTSTDQRAARTTYYATVTAENKTTKLTGKGSSHPTDNSPGYRRDATIMAIQDVMRQHAAIQEVISTSR